MKDMTTEVFATLSIIILSWVVLLAADAALCGILNLIAGISFRKAFLWGCISLIIPAKITDQSESMRSLDGKAGLQDHRGKDIDTVYFVKRQ